MTKETLIAQLAERISTAAKAGNTNEVEFLCEVIKEISKSASYTTWGGSTTTVWPPSGTYTTPTPLFNNIYPCQSN